ncbi:MAG: thymidylate kinase [Alistipes sp.]|nr:thymidylate kinase [Alistipes sp.]
MPFIVLEGLDGAGKSTQLDLLKSHLSRCGFGYEYLHFPRFDAPVYGELIARFLRGELGPVDAVDPYLVALIFAGDRADAAPEIRRWLAEGKYVVTDRYVHSNIAFQCAKLDGAASRDELKRWILDLEYGTNNLPVPDVSLFLDVPFSFTESRLTGHREGDDRAYLKGRTDIHEDSLELQKRVREIYLGCADEGRGLGVVDCSDGRGGMDTPANNFLKIVEAIRCAVPGMPAVKPVCK